MRFPGFRVIGLTGSLLAMLVTMGVHWDLLQSLAWARMLAEYSSSESLSQAVEKTFDGKHPCPLCLKVRDGRQEQERQQRHTPSLNLEAKSDLFWQQQLVAVPLPPLNTSDLVPFVPPALRVLAYCPPKPPPRS